MPSPEELEDAAAREATEGLQRRLNKATGRALALWQHSGSQALPAILGLLEEVSAVDDAYAVLARHAGIAVQAGMDDAAKRLRVDPLRRRVFPPVEVAKVGATIGDKVDETIRQARELARTATTLDDLQAALGVAGRSVGQVDRAARFTVNASLSAGVEAVTTEHGALRLWIAERDACVECLAYQGLTAGAGEEFPGGLTFGTRPSKHGPLSAPPLHPNCRCRIVPHLPAWGSDYPEALKREAQRSVLRGWARPSEGERTRLAAADKLLKRGTTLPKSVQDYARKSVKAGTFARGQMVPALPITPGKKLALTGHKAGPEDAFAKLPRKKPVPQGRPSPEAELLADRKAVNPHYNEPEHDSGEPIYKINCQRVTVAYELRRRGYDVEALPNRRSKDKQYQFDAILDLWRTKDGQRPKWYDPGTFSWQDYSDLRAANITDSEFQRSKWMADKVRARVSSWPPGARGYVGVVWRGGHSAHIYNVEVLPDGTVHWVDAQPDEDASDHLNGAERWMLLRVDELVPQEEQVAMVKPGR